MTIFDIRGTNGSGKSQIVHELIAKHESREICTEPSMLPFPYDKNLYGVQIQSLSLYVLGRYRTQCGGCDGITSQSVIERAAEEAQRSGSNVIIEGSIVATVFERWSNLAARVGNAYLFCFLDTPDSVAIERVLARRVRAGNTDPFDPNKTLVPRSRSIARVRARLEEAGRKCVTIDYTRSYEAFMEIYNEAHHRAVD